MKCTGSKPNGEQCRGEAMKGERYCYGHHPRYSERRSENSTRAGKLGGRGRPSRRRELQEVKRLNKILLGCCATGTLSISAGSHLHEIIDLLKSYAKLCELELKHEVLPQPSEDENLHVDILGQEALERAAELEEQHKEREAEFEELAQLAVEAGIELPASLYAGLSKVSW